MSTNFLLIIILLTLVKLLAFLKFNEKDDLK